MVVNGFYIGIIVVLSFIACVNTSQAHPHHTSMWKVHAVLESLRIFKKVVEVILTCGPKNRTPKSVNNLPYFMNIMNITVDYKLCNKLSNATVCVVKYKVVSLGGKSPRIE